MNQQHTSFSEGYFQANAGIHYNRGQTCHQTDISNHLIFNGLCNQRLYGAFVASLTFLA